MVRHLFFLLLKHKIWAGLWCSSNKVWIYDFLKYVLLLFMLLQLSQFFTLCPPPITGLISTVNPHTIVHVRGSFTHVWLIPSSFFKQFPPPSSPLTTVSLFHAWFYAFGFILLISFFCSLDSSDKWDHMVFVFHQLAYFT